MWAFCNHMKFAHLPVAGGILDQDPDLMDKWRYIFMIRSQIQEEERKKQEEQQKRAQAGGGKRPMRSSPRRRR